MLLVLISKPSASLKKYLMWIEFLRSKLFGALVFFRIVVKLSSNPIKGTNCSKSILATLNLIFAGASHFPEQNMHRCWQSMIELPESFTSSEWSSPTIAKSFSAIYHGNTSIYENNEHDKIAFLMGII